MDLPEQKEKGLAQHYSHDSKYLLNWFFQGESVEGPPGIKGESGDAGKPGEIN